MANTLSSFPVDDATLLAVEHAMAGALRLDDDGNPVLVGADYSMSDLLDFLAGCAGEDPNRELLNPADVAVRGEIPFYRDSRVHYHEHDVIRALIAEVRRLRTTEVPQ